MCYSEINTMRPATQFSFEMATETR